MFVLQSLHEDSMPCCFKCNKQLATVRDLCHHLRQGHLLYEPVKLSCAEEGCCRTFSRFNSFYCHLTVCHVNSPSDCNLPLASEALIEAEPPASLMALGSVEPLSTTSSHASFDVSGIKLHATNFLLGLTASSSMTLSQVEFVKNSVTELFSATIDKVKESVTSIVNQVESRCNVPCPEANIFVNELSALGNPFADVNSMYKLEKYVERLQSYVPPVEHIHGQRWEGADLQQQQKLKNDTFSYGSLEATLKHVLYWRRSWEEMCDFENDDGIELSSYFSGSNFKKIYGMIKDNIKVEFYPIVLQLYYDDFETVNPIGTKTGLHKLGGFYFTILNLSKKHNSKLDNIHLVQLAYRADIVKYGMKSILAPLRNELLRHKKGFDVVI